MTGFLAAGEGAIAVAGINLDASGNFSSASGQTAYRLQQTGSGCSMASTPADADVAICNVLAAGKAFVVCANTLTPHYTGTLFRQSDVQTVTHWELAGKTLTGIACGASGPRANGYRFVFAANGESAIEYSGDSTWNYGAGAPDYMERTTTCNVSSGGFCQRLVIFKLADGAATHYFLMVLWQVDPTLPARPVNLYFLQT